jgi:hypothetical protein
MRPCPAIFLVLLPLHHLPSIHLPMWTSSAHELRSPEPLCWPRGRLYPSCPITPRHLIARRRSWQNKSGIETRVLARATVPRARRRARTTLFRASTVMVGGPSMSFARRLSPPPAPLRIVHKRWLWNTRMSTGCQVACDPDGHSHPAILRYCAAAARAGGTPLGGLDVHKDSAKKDIRDGPAAVCKVDTAGCKSQGSRLGRLPGRAAGT